jgi:hypothetical protein
MSRKAASGVGTYLGPGAFRAKDAEKRFKASQEKPLPPRCSHCRRSWDTVMIDGIVHCEDHKTSCDRSCGADI